MFIFYLKIRIYVFNMLCNKLSIGDIGIGDIFFFKIIYVFNMLDRYSFYFIELYV